MDQGVGHEVKRLREERGWSQAKLAVEADMSVSGVSMIENGQRNLTTTTLAKLAGALGVEVADFFPKEQRRLPFEDGERPKVEDIELARRFRQWEKDLEEFQASHGDYQGIIDKVTREMHQTAEELRGRSA